MMSNYYRMIKKRGFKLAIYYFLNVHLYDLVNSTDTERWLPKNKFPSRYKNKGGVLYMPAWTSVINLSFNFCKNYLGQDFKNYQFVDIGCGKGKVLMVWEKNCKKKKIKMKISGIDYYKPLVLIANKNLKKFSKIKIVTQDVISYNFNNKKTIFFLYNPFNLNVFKKIVSKLKSQKYIIIYNNPVHLNFLKKNNFKEILSVKKFHRSGTLSILSYQN